MNAEYFRCELAPSVSEYERVALVQFTEEAGVYRCQRCSFETHIAQQFAVHWENAHGAEAAALEQRAVSPSVPGDGFDVRQAIELLGEIADEHEFEAERATDTGEAAEDVATRYAEVELVRGVIAQLQQNESDKNWLRAQRDTAEQRLATTRTALEAAEAALVARRADSDGRFANHTKAVGAFLSEMYATMIDPLGSEEMKVEETCAALLAAAVTNRQAIADLTTRVVAAEADTRRLDRLIACSWDGMVAVEVKAGERVRMVLGRESIDQVLWRAASQGASGSEERNNA